MPELQGGRGGSGRISFLSNMDNFDGCAVLAPFGFLPTLITVSLCLFGVECRLAVSQCNWLCTSKLKAKTKALLPSFYSANPSTNWGLIKKKKRKKKIVVLGMNE